MIFKRRKKLDKNIKDKVNPTTQNTINFKSLDENGILHIQDNLYSKTFKLGDVEYITAKHDDKLNIIDSYAQALNLLEGGSTFQLTIVNKKITVDKIDRIKYKLENNNYDLYRKEYNKLINDRFENNAKGFEVNKYVTIGIEGTDISQARRQLNDISGELIRHFNEIDIRFNSLNGVERLALFNELINNESEFNFDYEDIKNSRIGEKSYIAPARIEIKQNYLQINEQYTKVIYIKHFPKSLNDKLIRNLTNLSFEIVISINANM